MATAPESNEAAAASQHAQELLQSPNHAFALHEIICNDAGEPIDYRFLAITPQFEAMTGLKADDIVGRTVLDIMPDTEKRWIDTYGKVALTGQPVHFENYARELKRYYEVTAYCPSPGRFATVFTDVTERKHAEAEHMSLELRMLQTQKLESLGLLAGGIAHDFNNLLMAILGNADLALGDLSPVSPAREPLHDIETAARHAADLCRQLLAYSGKGRFQVQHIDLTELIEEMSSMLKVTLSKKATVRYCLERKLPAVEADASQLRQIVLNLITNASEAIGDAAGTITVSTGASFCDEAYLSTTAGQDAPAAGTYVFFEVSDTGCGMSADVMDRVFDPFFTTKFTGRGLGMSAVLGIVRGHGGGIRVYSEPGRGTTFKVLLPAAEAKANALPKARPVSTTWSGEGRVLVVDDEPSLLAVTTRMLERMGFNAITASDGIEAVSAFAEHKDDLRAVILDLTMPGMDGEETFREIRALRADIPVILSSGYNKQDAIERFVGKGLAAFIQKPYRSAQLASVMQEILEGDA